MLGKCDNCPDKEQLRDYLFTIFGDYDEDQQVFYTQWDTTDRCTLSKHVTDIPNFIEKLLDSLEVLRPHSFISHEQSKYLDKLKNNIDNSSFIFLGDFAENYSFVVQDEVQSFHWNNMMCTLQPVVIYYKENNIVKHLSYCIISDDNSHDISFVYKVIQIIFLDIKNKMPSMKQVYLFTDGCAGQYKNRKTLFNLCQIEKEFQLKAEWNFFATSHGKSPCDGLGGTIKRLTAAESLSRPYNDQILNAKDMFTFCTKQIPGITFIYVGKDEMDQLRKNHQNRYELINQAIPGTRSFHQFIPISSIEIGAKRCSTDVDFAIRHKFSKLTIDNDVLSPSISSYVAVIYDSQWWIGIVIDKSDDNMECKIKFMHPNGPSKFYMWPQREDVCLLPNKNIIKLINIPETCGSARKYSIDQKDVNEITQIIEYHKQKKNINFKYYSTYSIL